MAGMTSFHAVQCWRVVNAVHTQLLPSTYAPALTSS